MKNFNGKQLSEQLQRKEQRCAAFVIPVSRTGGLPYGSVYTCVHFGGSGSFVNTYYARP